MKRTKHINKNAFRKVGQYALPFVVALTVTGCEKADVDMKMYKNVDECIADTHKPDQCRAARAEAEKVANETAPRYATYSDCYEEFGDQCRHNPSSSDGGSSWMPLMMGYMLGNSMNSGYHSAPLYQDRSGRYMDNTFRKYDVRPGQSFKVTKSAAKPSIQSPRTTVARSSTVTRGGFGKSVSSRSSFGG
ncbi:hypothetical protein EspYZU14_24 [Cronobacter phage EspYZU14]|nr:hypothetical protein EspYZU14_24 [Cronobacter phage EspYZU14]